MENCRFFHFPGPNVLVDGPGAVQEAKRVQHLKAEYAGLHPSALWKCAKHIMHDGHTSCIVCPGVGGTHTARMRTSARDEVRLYTMDSTVSQHA